LKISAGPEDNEALVAYVYFHNACSSLVTFENLI